MTDCMIMKEDDDDEEIFFGKVTFKEQLKYDQLNEIEERMEPFDLKAEILDTSDLSSAASGAGSPLLSGSITEKQESKNNFEQPSVVNQESRMEVDVGKGKENTSSQASSGTVEKVKELKQRLAELIAERKLLEARRTKNTDNSSTAAGGELGSIRPNSQLAVKKEELGNFEFVDGTAVLPTISHGAEQAINFLASRRASAPSASLLQYQAQMKAKTGVQPPAEKVMTKRKLTPSRPRPISKVSGNIEEARPNETVVDSKKRKNPALSKGVNNSFLKQPTDIRSRKFPVTKRPKLQIRSTTEPATSKLKENDKRVKEKIQVKLSQHVGKKALYGINKKKVSSPKPVVTKDMTQVAKAEGRNPTLDEVTEMNTYVNGRSQFNAGTLGVAQATRLWANHHVSPGRLIARGLEKAAVRRLSGSQRRAGVHWRDQVGNAMIFSPFSRERHHHSPRHKVIGPPGSCLRRRLMNSILSKS